MVSVDRSDCTGCSNARKPAVMLALEYDSLFLIGCEGAIRGHREGSVGAGA